MIFASKGPSPGTVELRVGSFPARIWGLMCRDDLHNTDCSNMLSRTEAPSPVFMRHYGRKVFLLCVVCSITPSIAGEHYPA